MKGVMTRNLKCFTVIELIVTMVISGIVILAALEFFTIYNKLFIRKNYTLDSYNEMFQAASIMKNDIADSDKLYCSGNKLTTVQPSGDTIIYELMDNYFLRSCNEQYDTLRVVVSQEGEDGLINSLNSKVLFLKINSISDLFNLILEKRISNDVLMNNKIFRENQADGSRN